MGPTKVQVEMMARLIHRHRVNGLVDPNAPKFEDRSTRVKQSYRDIGRFWLTCPQEVFGRMIDDADPGTRRRPGRAGRDG